MSDARSFGEQLCSRFTTAQREWLAADPFAAVAALTDLTVEIREPADVAGSGCSVEGLYLEEARTIRVMRAMSPRRTKFTTLHELGHDLARTTTATSRYLFGLAAKVGRTVEEQIADAVAAELLVPSAEAEGLLDGRRPAADDVADLFELVEGSREACCVRMAQYFGNHDGYVLLAEGSVVRFCATAGGAYRVRRGTDQGTGHLLAIAASTGSATADQVRLRYRSGFQTPEYGGHAVLRDGYVYAVLTSATSLPWGGWRTPGDSNPGPVEYRCRGCDEDVESWKRCDGCGEMVCPHTGCGWCPCQGPGRRVVDERWCPGCTMKRRVDLFDPGSDLCRDCL